MVNDTHTRRRRRPQLKVIRLEYAQFKYAGNPDK